MTSRKNGWACMFGLLGIVTLAQPAAAGTILSPVAVINNTIGNYSGIAGFPAKTDEKPMFNQSGLSAGFSSGATAFADYMNLNPTHIGAGPEIGNGWISPAYCPCTGILDFDLGAIYKIQKMALWNMASNSGANVASISLFTSLEADFSTSNKAGDFTNPEMPSDLDPTPPYPATVFDLIDSEARYVRLQINSYYEAYLVSEIGEIAFDVAAPAAVPIPAGIWLFVSGFAGWVGSSKKAGLAAAVARNIL
ncbi:hypothetical protein [Methylomonas sp. YC3]